MEPIYLIWGGILIAFFTYSVIALSRRSPRSDDPHHRGERSPGMSTDEALARDGARNPADEGAGFL